MDSSVDGLEQHDITMPVEIARAARRRAGADGLSAYITRAVTRQLERDALNDAIPGMHTRHGAVEEAEVAAILRRLGAPADEM